MRTRSVIRKISLRRKIFQYLLWTNFISIMLLGLFWIKRKETDYRKEIRNLKESFSETKKSEIRSNILQLKEWIYWIRNHPDEAVSRAATRHLNTYSDSNSNNTEKFLQEYCLDSLSRIRYAVDEYVFINTFDGNALISNGKINNPPVNIFNAGDTSWIRIFRAEQLAKTKPGGLFYNYSFRKISSSKYSMKTSYISYFPEWDWIIGTGYYEDDINPLIQLKREELIRNMRNSLIKVAPLLLITIIFSFGIVLLFSRRMAKNVEIFKDFFAKAASDKISIDKSKVSYKEFDILAETANQMVEESIKAEVERQKTERIIEVREQQLSLIYSNVLDAIYYLAVEPGERFRFLSVNHTFLTLTGHTENQILNKYVDEILQEPSLSGRLEKYRKAIEEKRTVQWEEISFFPSGEKNGMVSITPLFDSNGKCINMVGTVHDITARKRAEEELKLHRDHLEELVIQRTVELEIEKENAQSADRLKSAFLATMSHELRTPLNSIIGFTGILMQERPGPLNDEQKKQLGMAQNSARHLLSLINDVLDISKIEAGQLKMNFQFFNLHDIINKVVDTNKPFADKKKLKILVSVDENLKDIRSDNLRVQQILLNLVNNAIKFTETGIINISCCTAGEFVIIKITDTGIGIEKEKIEQLFKPFMQIDTGLTRKHEGTGLGLSICRKLTEMLNGKIEVESIYGSGSTFTITLPII